jgi:hypothetical protein
MKSERRVFMIRAAMGLSALLAEARSQAAYERISVDDPYTKSMGFRLNTEQVDQVKYPRHTVEQHCSRCQLWKGKDGDDYADCSFFERSTPRNGWCKNFKVRKAAAA